MPSFWQWLCVSRQRYNTNGSAKPSPKSKRAGLSAANHPDVLFEIQQELSLHGKAEPERRRHGSSYSSRHLDEQDSYRVTDKDSGLVKRRNSHEKKEFGARYSALNDSFEQRSPTNHRQVQADKPHPFGLASNQLLRRSNSEEVRAASETDNVRKRRHVQDIFTDSSSRRSNQTSSQILYTSDPSLQSVAGQQGGRRNWKSVLDEEPRKRESMYGYTPRSVNDDAISAALFGGRIDDYNPDPSWNRAIDRFASSPTSGVSTNFSRQGRPRSEILSPVNQLTQNSTDSNCDVSYSPASRVSPTSRVTSEKGPVTLVTGSNGKESAFFDFGFQKTNNDVHTDLDVTSLNMRGEDAHERQVSPVGGSDLDLEKVFSCNGDVLY